MGNSVDHPSHYHPNSIEVIDAIEAWNLNFSLGNAVKYIARSGLKDPKKTTEDLEKAMWYLNRELTRIKTGHQISHIDHPTSPKPPPSCPHTPNQSNLNPN